MKKFKFIKFLALFLALIIGIFLILDQIYPLNLDALKKDEAKILLDKNVRVHAIPTLFCKEDDVIGEHYASIGKVDEATRETFNFFPISFIELRLLFTS